MAGTTFKGHNETYEELLAIFSVFYSIRIYICICYPVDYYKFKVTWLKKVPDFPIHWKPFFEISNYLKREK